MITAVIVLFNPDIHRLKQCLDSVLHQVKYVFLIDNGSKNILEVRKLIDASYDNKNTCIISNPTNKGIAHALNQGIIYSSKEGATWVLTLDQDTIIPQNLISEYSKVIESEKKCGIVTCRVNYNNERIEQADGERCQVNYAITSASLLNISICKKLGGYDETMFIDGVDFEYCYRLVKAGYIIVKTNEVIIDHELGNLKTHSFFGKKVNVENHNSFRTYYISRNYIYRYRKNKGSSSLGKCIKKELDLLLKIVVFENEKFKKIKSIFKGIYDGINIKIDNNNYLGEE